LLKGGVRWSAALFLCTVAAAAFLWSRRATRPPDTRLLATAHQFGPVGYRDPAGAISPDGHWLAYSEGRFLRIVVVDEDGRAGGAGGAGVAGGAGEAQIRRLSWDPTSRFVLTDGFGTQAGWGVWDREAGTRRRLWPSDDSTILKDAVWSPDAARIAAVVNGRDGQELRIVSIDGATMSTITSVAIAGRASWPAWLATGTLACIVTADGRARITIPCGGTPVRSDPDLDAYGPLAFSPDGRTVYAGLANPAGLVDLWALPSAGGRGRQLSLDRSSAAAASRDAYGPSVAADGAVVFRSQRYQTHVAVAPASGGAPERLAAFQSETPSWDPTGRWLGLTYGSWRRLVDDARYPDIAQDVGIIEVKTGAPSNAVNNIARDVHSSASEDQSLCWSPNGKWIAFHSHKDGSDDIWLRPARGDTATPTRLSFLGRGAEAGWPRWSPDGKWLLFDGASRTSHHAVGYVLGIDQETGAVTQQPRELPVRGVGGEFSHGEWIGSDTIVALNEDGPGADVIYTVPRDGGAAHIVRRFETEHHAPGLGVSPDGRDVAFIAPAADGYFQVFRMTVAGGAPVQVTTDPSNKTQPAWSPDGQRIAFTVWTYDMLFWLTR
jgi:Tol biopolymer transport system component